MKPESTLQLNRYLPALINFFSNKMSNGTSQLYAHLFNMGVTDWRIISLLAVEPNISASRICYVIGLDKGAISRSLAKLNQDGFVTIKADKKDTRARKNTLTEAGIALHDQIYKVAMEREQQILSVLSSEDQEHLIRIMNVLNLQITDINEFFFEKYLAK